MAKFAPIASPELLSYLKKNAPNLFGDYHLLLAQDVLKRPDDYKKLFPEGHNYHIIMDNGACEGEPVFDRLTEAAAIVNARVICLPDVLGDAEGTLSAISQFLDQVTARDFTWYHWMGIPQGKTEDEILRCAEKIMGEVGTPHYWGIPRWISNKLGTRQSVALALSSPLRKNIHLLGMSENLEDDIKCARHKSVIGMDSANPLVLGQLGLDLSTEYQHMPRELMIDGDMWNFWNETVPTETTINNLVKIRSLIP